MRSEVRLLPVPCDGMPAERPLQGLWSWVWVKHCLARRATVSEGSRAPCPSWQF